MTMLIDVTNINSAESFLLVQLTGSFSFFAVYAKRLLYYFVAFEIVLSGLGWALYQSQFAERLFFQLIKIGLIFFFVENYTSLLNSLLGSIHIIGSQLGGNTEKFILNPGLLWQYGYNFAVSLLELAATSDGFALPLIFTVLGMGILLVVGIFGIQVFIQVLSFYFVAAMCLFIMPLSAFTPLRDYFSQCIRSLLQAGLRLMVIMLLVSAAIGSWSVMRLQPFSTTMNINVPLGFFFSGLLFVFAASYLPRVVERIVGTIQWQSITTVTAPAVSIAAPAVAATSVHAHASMTASPAQASLANSVTPPTPPSASITAGSMSSSNYTSGIRTDFMAKQSSNKENTSGHTKRASPERDRERRDDVEKIKRAFSELVEEIRNKQQDK